MFRFPFGLIGSGGMFPTLADPLKTVRFDLPTLSELYEEPRRRRLPSHTGGSVSRYNGAALRKARARNGVGRPPRGK